MKPWVTAFTEPMGLLIVQTILSVPILDTLQKKILAGE